MPHQIFDKSCLLHLPQDCRSTLQRFPVRELDVLASTLTEAGFAPTTRGSARLPPYGVVEVLVVRGPNGEWLEFYEDTSGVPAYQMLTRCFGGRYTGDDSVTSKAR